MTAFGPVMHWLKEPPGHKSRSMEERGKIMKVFKNGSKIEMAYDAICKDLGFVPDVHFVKVTTQGRISFTCGKPDEVRSLVGAARRNNYMPADKLLEATK